MTSLISNLLSGIVVQTDKESWTGEYIYSDFCYDSVDGRNYEDFCNNRNPFYKKLYDSGQLVDNGSFGAFIFQNCALNKMAKIPILGIVAGVTRSALSVIHILGHLFVALVKWERGHLYHAAKGGCEFIRGIIEALPVIGRIFSYSYCKEFSIFFQTSFPTYSWWILKIYNPNQPDLLDTYANNWQYLRNSRPDAFIIA